MAGYTQDFLVSAFADKYEGNFKTTSEFLEFKQKFGHDHYAKVGKDTFRKDCSLDAAAVKEYKESLK